MSKIGQIIIDLTTDNLKKVTEFLGILGPDGDLVVTGPPAPPADQGAAPAPPADQGAAPAPPENASIEVDVNRIPWDERIHASTRTKNKDGSWRNRPGLDKDLLATVTAELKQKYGTPQGALNADAPVPPSDQGAAPVPPDGNATKDYIYLIQRVPGIDAKKIAEVLAKYGISALPELYNKPEICPIICEELGI